MPPPPPKSSRPTRQPADENLPPSQQHAALQMVRANKMERVVREAGPLPFHRLQAPDTLGKTPKAPAQLPSNADPTARTAFQENLMRRVMRRASPFTHGQGHGTRRPPLVATQSAPAIHVRPIAKHAAALSVLMPVLDLPIHTHAHAPLALTRTRSHTMITTATTAYLLPPGPLTPSEGAAILRSPVIPERAPRFVVSDERLTPSAEIHRVSHVIGRENMCLPRRDSYHVVREVGPDTPDERILRTFRRKSYADGSAQFHCDDAPLY